MDAPPPSTTERARLLVEQCRRELAAAWEQVEAGRAILHRSAWLLARWRGQATAGEPAIAVRESVAGMFVTVEAEQKPRRRHAIRVRRAERARSVASG